MSWSYDNPEASEKDALRFEIQDTNEKNQLFSDEELWYLINKYDNDKTALLYTIYSSLADRYARTGGKRSLGPQMEDTSSRASYYAAKAKDYENKLSARGLPTGTYNYPKIFYKGMNNNPVGSVPCTPLRHRRFK